MELPFEVKDLLVLHPSTQKDRSKDVRILPNSEVIRVMPAEFVFL